MKIVISENKFEWHNENGPSIIYPNGNERYFLNNKKYSKEEWERERLKWLDHRGFPMSAKKDYFFE